MEKEAITKSKGRFSGKTLFRVVCLLFVFMALTAWSVSGVYAKYVSSASTDSTAGVAHMGVEVFDILEHRAEDISSNLDDIVTYSALYGYDTLYKLVDKLVGKTYSDDLGAPKKGNEYKTVIPGTDIPKDPFVQLKLKSNEVSFELYIIVKEEGFLAGEDNEFINGNTRIIDYELTKDWELVSEYDKGKSPNGEYKYRYVGGSKFGVVNGVFKAGTPYNFTVIADPNAPRESDDEEESRDGENELQGTEGGLQNAAQSVIQILKDDKIKVSQRFDSDKNNKDAKFKLTFTAYLQQVIVIPEDPEVTPDPGDSVPDGD